MSVKVYSGRQGGFTLVELMVTLAISTVLMAAIYQSYLVSQRSYRMLEGLAQLQENARFSMDVLSRTIRMTGYKRNAGDEDTFAFPGGATFAAAGQVVAGTNNNADGGDSILDGSDTITIRYQGNTATQMTNCLGASVTDGYTAVDTFYINTKNELRCSSTIAGTQPLADGAEDMQVLFGIDTTEDKIADIYKNAGNVTAAEWGNVVTVRISMLFNTINRAPGMSGTQTFTLLDGYAQSFTDDLRRQLFTATINLRNRTP